MRKKYLSALLFGALLFASAGTFTSCKDYDDDINNLQEQINTINTSLDELTDKINALGAGVTDFKYENGKLVIVTDKGTNFEVTLPEAGGIQELEIKDGVLYADGEAVGPVAGEGGAVSVEVKDGVLYINGEAQELEVGSNVVVTDNGDGTYTLTVDGTSIVLPKASVDVAVALQGEYYFTNLTNAGVDNGQNALGGIQWGTAEKYKGDWKGLKAVAKGQLLIGQTKTISVKTLAATYDLSTAKLTLVNTLGEQPAPVTVTPVAEGKQGPAIGDSRAADENGMWDLQIAMTSDVTADNIGTAFAAKDPADDYKFKNVQYALAIDGKVVTDYVIYVDTEEKKATRDFSFTVSGGTPTTALNFKVNGIEKDVTSEALPIGTTTTLYLTPASGSDKIDFLYDSYIEIMDEDMAERYGITVEGMSVTVSNDAAAVENLPIKIHALDVNGNETVSSEIMLDFAAATADGETIAAQTYTVMPTTATEGEFVLVDLGNTFTSLTAEQADKISKRTDDGAATWYTTTDNKTFDLTSAPAIEGGLKVIKGQNGILYYASKEDALKDALKNDPDLAIKVKGGKSSTIRTITYAAIPVSTTFKAAAETGTNVITIILQDKDNNQIKKVSADYTVNLPAFDDVLEANAAQNLWNEAKDTYNARVISNSGNGEIELLKTFISKKDSNGKEYYDVNTADGSLVYELTYTDFDKKEQTVEVNGKTQEPLTGKLVKDGELIHDIEVTATLYPLGTSYTNLKVTKTFKIYLKSVFEDATLTYYGSDNKPIEGPMTLEDYQYIYSGDNTNNKKTGLFVNFDGEIREYWFDGVNKFTNGPEILPAAVDSEKANLTIGIAGSQTDGQVNPFIYLGDGATGATLTKTYVNSGTRGALQLGNVAGGTSGTVVFTFVDKMGVQTTATLEYKK